MAKAKHAHAHPAAATAATTATTQAAVSTRKPARSKRRDPVRWLVMLALGCLVGFFSGKIVRDWHTPVSHTLTAGRYNVTCAAASASTADHCSIPADGSCARIIVDDFVSAREVATLRAMAELGMSFGSGSGGPTIFDVATGAASRLDQFTDAYKQMAQRQAGTPASARTPPAVFTAEQVALYRRTTQRAKKLIERELGVGGLYLASPSFFSRINSARARTAHDEYTHPHVDKKQYGSFAYTALLYLSTQGDDFEGGDFVFLDGADGVAAQNESSASSLSLVRPEAGRLSVFTSGEENVHAVRAVTDGVRRALTIAFTCDPKKSVEDTLLKRADEMIRIQSTKWPQSAAAASGSEEEEEDVVVVGADDEGVDSAPGASQQARLLDQADLKRQAQKQKHERKHEL